MSNLLNVGRLNGAYGIKGWVKVHSETESPSDLFDYRPWQLKTKHGVKAVDVVEWRPHGKDFVAKIKGIEDRNQAEALCPVVIAIEKSLLPALEQDEYYWHELEGCRVFSTFKGTEVNLGTVKRILPTGSNDVLVVVGDNESLDCRERLIPYVPDQFVLSVDIGMQKIIVDWDPEF
jgi:16S rRNA processing protein RimM